MFHSSLIAASKLITIPLIQSIISFIVLFLLFLGLFKFSSLLFFRFCLYFLLQYLECYLTILILSNFAPAFVFPPRFLHFLTIIIYQGLFLGYELFISWLIKMVVPFHWCYWVAIRHLFFQFLLFQDIIIVR